MPLRSGRGIGMLCAPSEPRCIRREAMSQGIVDREVTAEFRFQRTAPAGANPIVRQWVDECAAMCEPDAVIWCDGSERERNALFDQGVRDGIFIRLNQQKLPGCYLHRSNQNDVARSEHLTFICTPSEDM